MDDLDESAILNMKTEKCKWCENHFTVTVRCDKPGNHHKFVDNSQAEKVILKTKIVYLMYLQ